MSVHDKERRRPASFCKYCGEALIWRQIDGRTRAFTEATGQLHKCSGYRAVHPIRTKDESVNEPEQAVDNEPEQDCNNCRGVVVSGRCINCGRKFVNKEKRLKV